MTQDKRYLVLMVVGALFIAFVVFTPDAVLSQYSTLMMIVALPLFFLGLWWTAPSKDEANARFRQFALFALTKHYERIGVAHDPERIRNGDLTPQEQHDYEIVTSMRRFCR